MANNRLEILDDLLFLKEFDKTITKTPNRIIPRELEKRIVTQVQNNKKLVSHQNEISFNSKAMKLDNVHTKHSMLNSLELLSYNSENQKIEKPFEINNSLNYLKTRLKEFYAHYNNLYDTVSEIKSDSGTKELGNKTEDDARCKFDEFFTKRLQIQTLME
jgi:hypothetical protein